MIMHNEHKVLPQKLFRRVREAANPEKIFLLGRSYTSQCSENIFGGQSPEEQQVTTYFMLVLLRPDDRRSDDEVQDQIEQRCRDLTAVTALVLPVKTFNKWLQEGQLFAVQVYRHATLLFDAEQVALAIPRTDNSEALREKLRSECLHTYHLATEFFAGAELYTLRRQFNLAAFLLHQATEHTCIALIRRCTGYRAGTHNLDKLLRYTAMSYGEALKLFSRQSEADQQLFRVLQKAYIHGRYKYDFSIQEDQLLDLLQKVKQLLQLGGRVLETQAGGPSCKNNNTTETLPAAK